MKKHLLLICLLFICLALSAEPLTLFFTNDTHGAYLPNKYKNQTGSIELGGYENLYNLIIAQRDTIKNTLWLDAGDQQTGSVYSSIKHKGVIGGAVIETFNHMGLDATTFGNHEFDQSFENTIKLTKLAKYPFLSANLVYKKNGKPITNEPYKIFTKGKLKIGVLGLTLIELREKVKIENTNDIDILPYKQAIDKYIDELDKKTDLIILLTHNGIEADSLLATQLDNRIDIIVGGHTHAYTEKPMLVNGIYVVQTGAFLTYYGRLDLDIIDDKIASKLTDTTCLFPVLNTETTKADAFHKFFFKTVNNIDSNMDKVIGYTDVDWYPDKFKETAVSQWHAEALLAEYKDKYHPDIAMINCGGIRKAIPAGEITMRDMTEMLPFNNYIVIFSCRAADLVTLDNMNKKNRIEKPYDIIQTTLPLMKTYVGYREVTKPDGTVDAVVGESILDPNKIYRVVSHDYVTGQWEKYLGFEPFDITPTNDLILDVMVRQVKKQLGKKKL